MTVPSTVSGTATSDRVPRAARFSRSVRAVLGSSSSRDRLTTWPSCRRAAIQGYARLGTAPKSGSMPSRVHEWVAQMMSSCACPSSASTARSRSSSCTIRSSALSMCWGTSRAEMNAAERSDTRVSKRSRSASSRWARRRWARLTSRPTMRPACTTSATAPPTMYHGCRFHTVRSRSAAPGGAAVPALEAPARTSWARGLGVNAALVAIATSAANTATVVLKKRGIPAVSDAAGLDPRRPRQLPGHATSSDAG